MKREALFALLFCLIFPPVGYWILGISWRDVSVIVLTGIVIFSFLSNLSHRINYLGITAVAACISYLAMPAVTYIVFDKHNRFAANWYTFMTVDAESYFRLALPATLALLLGFWLPGIPRVGATDLQLMNNLRNDLKGRSYVGIVLIGAGLSVTPFVPLVPTTFQAIAYLVSQLTYIGALYILFSNIPFKSLAISFTFCLLLFQTIITGMYGELVYWSALGMILLLIRNRPLSAYAKLVLLGVGIFTLFLIQSIKHEYRAEVWDGSRRGNDPGLFFSLVADRLQNPSSIFEGERLYRMVVRANQGMLVGRAMEHVPKFEPFARGETIGMALAASMVPRFLWPDKPETGGKANICRFLGDCGDYNYSYNIGQLGEAYVNFGVIGATFIMFFYGYILKNLLVICRLLAVKRPTLLLWTPLFFFAALSVETDFLTFFNSFLKGIVFYLICIVGFQGIIKIRL